MTTITTRKLPLALLLVGVLSTLATTGCKAADKPTAADAAALAAAQNVPPPPPDPSMTPTEFAQAAAEADLLQIRLGKLAAQNADAQTVKDFGQRMSTNHTAIQVILTKAASAQGIALPTQLDSADEARVLTLAAMHGTAFDKSYMTLMAEKTAKTLAMFKWQYDNCSDATLKPFAMQTTPIIGTHARVAEQLNAEVNKEELRIAAEAKAAELKAAEQRRAEEAAAAAAKKPASKRAKPAPASHP